MTFNFQQTQENGAEPVVVPAVEEVEVPKADVASDMEVARLQAQIDAMNAAAQRIENDIQQMLAETGGNAANSSEYATAVKMAQEMHSSANGAKAALTSAPTDPRTGRKMISSQKVASLSNTMGNFIIGGEAEGEKIEAATAVAVTHSEADHEKAAARTKPAEPLAKCSHLEVCLGVHHASSHNWVHDTFAPVSAFGTRISNGFSRHWNGWMASVSTIYTQIDPIGTVERAAADVSNVATGLYVGAKMHVTAIVTSVSEGTGHLIASAKEKWHEARAAIADKIHSIFHRPTVVAKVDKAAHSPIHVNPNAMETALAQAKSVVTHSLQHISMPNLMEFVPSSVPSLQGILGDIGLAH